MELLETYITTYGTALDEEVLKVDAFLNHQIDPALMMALGEDFKEHFKNLHIDKIATIETSGIAPSLMLAYCMQVPLVFFKKNSSKILQDNVYQCSVHSFTKDLDYNITCSKTYLQKNEHVLFIDDFMANGEACLGAISIIEQAEAIVSGIGIVIEKSFQPGRGNVEALGYPVYAQARIASMSANQITFINE